MPRVSRVLTEIWKSVVETTGLNASAARKRPSCALAFYLPHFMYDINLSPDKREVLINDEQCLLDRLKEGIIELWLSAPEGVFEANQVEKLSNNSAKQSTSNQVERSSDNSETHRAPTKMNRRNAF
eukprot:13087027-Ditylum_brightwellii.AAC.1